MRARILALLCTILSSASAASRLPILGWSTWNTFACKIDETLVYQTIDALAASPAFKAGYNYILIDDCWSACNGFAENGDCLDPTPGRDANGKLVVDPVKFPSGFESLTQHAHAKGLKIGIYTSTGALTCGGFAGSLQHEDSDAQSFVDWGFDFVKHDTCDWCGVRDGCIQNATIRMRDALFKYGKGSVVYYLDHGNPTSPQRVFNPKLWHVDKSKDLYVKVALESQELAWVWLSALPDPEKGPHMFKSFFDMKDTWFHTIQNVQNQIRVAEYQTCDRIHMPDMLTIGMGSMTQNQYRSQMFLWAVLGAPLIMGNDVRKMDDFSLSLLTAPEVLEIDQDPDCIQGSLARSMGATETWVRPLHDGSFAVVLLNKGSEPVNATLFIGDNRFGSDFAPATLTQVVIRDAFQQRTIGQFENILTWPLDAFDSVLLRVTPVTTHNSLRSNNLDPKLGKK